MGCTAARGNSLSATTMQVAFFKRFNFVQKLQTYASSWKNASITQKILNKCIVFIVQIVLNNAIQIRFNPRIWTSF